MSLPNSRTCTCCNGTGRESTITEDMSLALSMKRLRMNAGFSGCQMARKLGITESYVSMLESGKRRFTIALLKGYRRACRV